MQARPFRLMVVCGEVSGDQRAAEVIGALGAQGVALDCRGMGGAQLEALGVELVVDSREVAGVMGIVEVVSYLPRLLVAFRKLVQVLKEWQPDCLFLVDYPDFNLRLAKVAKRLGVPVYYYVPPKVWAWRASRVKQIKACVNELGVIFPFEPDFYKKHGIEAVRYVGHPFESNLIKPVYTRAQVFEKLGLDEKRPLLLLMAGSRSAELGRHVPVLYEVVRSEYLSEAGFQPVWALPSEKGCQHLRELLGKIDDQYQPVTYVGEAVQLMFHADFGLLKSGTCNLEAAFCGLPFACFYKAAPLSAWIVRNFIKIPEVSLVNIVRPKTVREFLQENCQGALLTDYLRSIWDNPLCNNRLCNNHAELQQLKADLGEVKASFDSGGLAANKVADRLISVGLAGKLDHE